MSDTVPLISNFNADILLQDLGIPREERNLCAAIRFLFHENLDDLGPKRSIPNRQHALRETHEYIKPRYDIFSVYADLFFEEKPYYYESVAIAALCHPSLFRIGEFPENKTPGFDDDVLDRASLYVEESLSLQTWGYKAGCEPASLFIACLDAFIDLNEIVEHPENLCFHEISRLLEIDLPAIRSLIPHAPAIGKQLQYLLGQAEQQVDSIRARTGQKKATHPPLQLIVSDCSPSPQN